VRDSARRLAETQRLKRTLLEAFGTGLKLELTWMPPSLRRAIYQALGIRVTASADGSMRAEARVDEATIRLPQEAERYAAGLKEIDKEDHRGSTRRTARPARAHEGPVRGRAKRLGARRPQNGQNRAGARGAQVRALFVARYGHGDD
jgi:hypothetical protein